MTRRAPALLAAGALALLLGACGSSGPVEKRVPGRTLHIYLSLPLTGASSLQGEAVRHGAELALADRHGRIGRYRIRLVVLNDATVASGGWDPNQTTINARTAAQDPAAVGYLGDLDSGATAVSIPVLNRAGVPEVSPTAGAVGLTSAGPGASPGEPLKYYPAGTRTFVRIAPNDATEASAVVSLQRSLGCRAPFVLQDGEVDAEDDAISYVLAAQGAGMHVLGVQSFQRLATDYSSLATAVAQAHPDCLLLTAVDERSTARLATALGQALPRARIFASSMLADTAFVSPGAGGIPVGLDSRVLVISPALAAASYPSAGRAFLARYLRLYGLPQLQAIFGYTAMGLLLRAVSRATDGGRSTTVDRHRVVQELLGTRGWASPLGSLTIEPAGDSSLRGFGVYRVVGGRLSFLRRIG